MSIRIEAVLQPSASQDSFIANVVITSSSQLLNPVLTLNSNLGSIYTQVKLSSDFIITGVLYIRATNPQPNAYAYSFLVQFNKIGTDLFSKFRGPPGTPGQPGTPGTSSINTNLSNAFYIDKNTTVPLAKQTGNIETPFSSFTQAVAAVPHLNNSTLFLIAPGGDYSGESGPIDLSGLGDVIFINLMISMIDGASDNYSGREWVFLPTFVSGYFVTCQGCAVIGNSTAGLFQLRNSIHEGHFIAPGGYSANECLMFADDSSVNSYGGSTVQFNQCHIIHSGNIVNAVGGGEPVEIYRTTLEAAITVTFTGLPGVLKLDNFTYQQWVIFGCSVINGTITVVDPNVIFANEVVPEVDAIINLLPNNPWGMTSDGTYIYVCDNGSEVIRILISSGATNILTDASYNSTRMAAWDGGSYVYIGNYGTNTVSRIDVSTGLVFDTITVGNNPGGIARDNSDHMYVVSPTDSTVTKIRISDGVILATIDIGSTPLPTHGYQWGVAWDGGSYMWVTDQGLGVIRIDIATDSIHDTLGPFGSGNQIFIAWDHANHMYVPDPNTDTIFRIRVSDGGLESPIFSIVYPLGITWDGASHMYVASGVSNTVSTILISSGVIDQTIDVGVFPWGVVWDNVGHIYVGNRGANTISRVSLQVFAHPSFVAPGDGVAFENLGTGLPLSIRMGIPNVKAVSLTNVNIAAPAVVADFDGVTFSSGDLVLLPRQSTAIENGLYFYQGTYFLPAIYKVSCGSKVYVEGGEIFAGRTFQQQTTGIPGNISPQVWQSDIGPHIVPPLTQYNGSGGSVTWHVLDVVPGPPADGYDLIVITDSIATKSTGGGIQRERGAVTYHLAGGVLTLSDDSRSLTAATYLKQVINSNTIELQVGQQAAATGDFTFRIRAWYEYVRSI